MAISLWGEGGVRGSLPMEGEEGGLEGYGGNRAPSLAHRTDHFVILVRGGGRVPITAPLGWYIRGGFPYCRI